MERLQATIALLQYETVNLRPLPWSRQGELRHYIDPHSPFAGIYLNTRDAEVVEKTAEKMSYVINSPVGIVKAPAHPAGFLLSVVIPRAPATCWRNTYKYIIFEGKRLYSKDLLDNCFYVHKFVEGGCLDCPELKDCVRKLVDPYWKEVLFMDENSLRDQYVPIASLEYRRAKQDPEGTNSTIRAIRACPWLEYISPTYTTVDEPIPRTLRECSDICFDEWTISETRGQIKARNRRAAKSREFGKKHCSNCALAGPIKQCAPPEYGKSEYWRRPLCDGKVSEEEVRDMLVEDLKNSEWQGIPSWNNKTLNMARRIIGHEYTIPTLGKRGQKGRIVNVVPSRYSRNFMDSVVTAERTWRPYCEGVCSVRELIEANPDLGGLLNNLPPRKTNRDQRIAIAWFLSKARPLLCRPFSGYQVDWPTRIEIPWDSTETFMVDIRMSYSWRSIKINKLSDLHRPWESIDLFPDIKSRKGANLTPKW